MIIVVMVADKPVKRLLVIEKISGVHLVKQGHILLGADQGAEQCGFCNPGFVMNALALFRENPYPDEEEIKEFLSGNLCRCSGYEGQLRGIMNFLEAKKAKEAE